MVKTKCQQTLLFYLLVVTTRSQKNETCPCVQSTLNEVSWPPTPSQGKTLSQPLCVNEAKELLYRDCTNGKWSSEPKCFYIQRPSPPECPDGFLETQDICYTFTEKTSYPPECPFFGTLPFRQYIHQIAENLSEAIWAPATRDTTHGFGLIQWTDPSPWYKCSYSYEYIYTSNIIFKDCVIYDKNNISMAVFCNEQHPGICAYSKLTQSKNKVCPTCKQKDLSSKTACICVEQKVESDNQSGDESEFLEPYQNNVYSILTNDTCTIGLRKSQNGSYIWHKTNQEITYTYWSPNVVFNNNYSYGALSPSGWILTEEKESCLLVEKEVIPEEPSMVLTFDSSSTRFVLTITNSFWLETFDDDTTVFCFTDANNSDLIYRHPNVSLIDNSTEKSVYEFHPVGPFPGYYWCEAFNFVNLAIIKTEKEFLQAPNRYEFAVIFQIMYSPIEINPLSSKAMAILQEIILNKYNSNINKRYYPRIMKIEDLYEEGSLIWVNVHFSSRNETYFSSLDKELNYLKYEINNSFNIFQKAVQGYTIYNTDYCFSEYTPNLSLNWPRTALKCDTYPKEFCFKTDGTRLTRHCGGDFLNGARWLPIDGCKILPSSRVTSSLLNLYNNQTPLNDINIAKIFWRYSTDQFKALDVYLLAQVVSRRYMGTSDIDIDSFCKLINQILNIDKQVLIESQLAARSADKLLSIIDHVAYNYSKPVKIVKDNFVFILDSPDQISGVLVQNFYRRVVNKLRGNWTLKDVLSKDSVDSAIWLSPQLRAKIQNIDKVAFTLFFTDSFFSDFGETSKKVSQVFGVYLRGFSGSPILPGPVSVLQHIVTNGNIQITCSFWNYAAYYPGFWMKDVINYDLDNFQLCDFEHASNFGLVATPNEAVASNVTPELVDLLGAEYLITERVNMLVNISENYEKFAPIDVFLVGQVLQTVSDERNTELNALVSVVNNLHKMERKVLSQSQVERKATDNILYHIDSIVNRYNFSMSEIVAVTDNFALIISDLKENNFTGLVIQKANQSFHIEILRDNITNKDILSFQNIDSAIVISPTLKKQFYKDSKVIITIFFNDVLFNEKSSKKKSVSKIFSVIFPQIGNYSGPISIFHNVSATDYQTECAHWNFNEEVNSYWKKDNNSTNLSSLMQCDYWHTTHFALLLLEEDLIGDIYGILDWITAINSSLSFMGLCGIIFTALLFKKWRKNIGNQILLNFVFAIAFQIIAFTVASTVSRTSDDYLSCTFVGAFLHYSIISQFCWMFIIAILQFKRFVIVFGTSPKYLLLKACLCGWLIPLVPVGSTLLLTHDGYVNSEVGFCYPSGLGLYLGVWLPIGIIGTLNFIIFIYIGYSVINRNIEPSISYKSESKYHWRLFVLLFSMFGLTWSFGFLSELKFGAIFVYLFDFTATLQGFVIFLYFIVFNSNTRHLYKHAFKIYCCRKDQ